MTFRDELKATVERGFVSSGLPAVARRGRRRGLLILAYHNIIPDGVTIDGESSLHLPVARFAGQLDLLRKTHDVVPLDSVLGDRPATGRRPRAVITFDDAYRGAVTRGIEEVVKRGMPATIFVAPAFVGGRRFWWDVMTPAGASGLSESFRRQALEECRGADDVVRRWGERLGYRPTQLPDEWACASEDELRAAAAQPGITVASHSWSHPNLCRLGRAELEEELARPAAWLSERFESVLPILSYPYGLSSPAVERVAAAAGYRAGVVIDGGWVSHRPRNPFALPRLNVPAGLSQTGFLLRTAGLFPR